MDNSLYKNLKSKISKAKSIFITTHIVPDADGIGSQISLAEALKKQGKKVFCVNEEKLEERYNFLDESHSVYAFEEFTQVRKNFTPDLVIIVDTNKIARTGLKMSQYLSLCKDIIFIDHHPFDKPIKNKHFIDTSASATGEMIGHFLNQINFKINKSVATALYTAILIDTNTFRYPSVTDKTHILISQLLQTGIKTTTIYNHLYGTKKLHHMHLLGHILSHTQTNKNGKVAWIYIQENELKKFQSDIGDTHAYINNLLVLEGVKIACMFREVDSKIKLSLRSHGDIDVGEIAQEFGGGGHVHSAATVLEVLKGYKKNDIVTNCITRIEDYLESSS